MSGREVGAAAAAIGAALAADLGEEPTLDALAGDLRIFQRRRGHRHSTDDLLTAWYAGIVSPPTGARRRLLDLGTGIGSVGLALLWLDPDAELVAIEAQDVSFRLLSANVELNGLGGRVRAIHGDLRDVRLEGPFDLVTGSPPYFPPGTGLVSSDSQRAHARFELRGDVSDYARAARAALAPDGVFVFCFPTAQRARAEAAVKDAGLALARSRDVVPRAGLPALFSLFACGHPGAELGARREGDLAVRDETGAHTADMLAARALLGLGREA